MITSGIKGSCRRVVRVRWYRCDVDIHTQSSNASHRPRLDGPYKRDLRRSMLSGSHVRYKSERMVSFNSYKGDYLWFRTSSMVA